MDIDDKLRDLVVRIDCDGDLGTAFLINRNMLLTAYHVIKKYKEPNVKIKIFFNTLGTKSKEATVIDCDEENDVAILKLNIFVNISEFLNINSLKISEDMKWRSYTCFETFQGTGNLFEKELIKGKIYQNEEAQNKKYDIHLDGEYLDQNWNCGFEGCSGSPLVINGFIVGIIVKEENSPRKSPLKAISIYKIEDYLNKHNINIKKISIINYKKKFEEISHDNKLLKNIKPYTINKTEKEIKKVYENLNQHEIILLDSYRNFGKTEVLYKIALNSEFKDMFDNIVFMKRGIKNVLEALQSEMIEWQTYLILIDDVDLCKDEFLELIRFVRVSNGINKIVATVQTYMLEDFKNIIIKEGLNRQFKNISLNNWEKEDLIELLKKASYKEVIEDEELIVVKYQSPALVSWIGEAQISTKVESVEELFSENKDFMLRDVYEILKDILSREECNKLIFNISCLVPLDLDDRFKQSIKELMEIDGVTFEKILNLLINGGIIRKVGYRYRFFPDIKGDIYLAYSLKNNLFLNEIQYWMNNNQERILENINMARFICKVDINEIITPVINEWLNADEYFMQSSILKKAINIISFAPKLILNLIYYYLQCAIDSNGEKYYKLTTDNFSPLLLQIWKFYDEKESVLEFVRLAEIYKLDGMYSNYKVKGIIESFFSPVNSSIKVISYSLEIIEKWLENNEEKSLTIAKYALSEILSGSHEVCRNKINNIEYGQGTVNATNEVILIRNKCISIIEYLINEQFNYQTVKAIEEICKSIGKNAFGNIKESELPLYFEIIHEREYVVDIIGTKLLSSDDISCNIIMERILIWWWVSKFEGTEKTEKYLIDFNKSYEYLFTQYYVNTSYRIFSFKEINKNAPNKERAFWIVHNIMTDSRVEKDIERVANLLNKKISTIEELAILLNNSSETIKKMGSCWSIPRILNKWCSLNIEMFLEYVGSSFYFETYELFKGDILSSIASINTMENNEELIINLLKNLDILTFEEINSILNFFINKELNDKIVIDVIYRIIRGNKVKHPGELIHKLYFIFKERNKESVIKILIDIINRNYFDEIICNRLDFLLKQFNDELRKYTDFEILKEIIIDRLIEFSDFKYHQNSILEVLLNSSDEALEFLVKRLSSGAENNYRIVSFDGFSFLNKFIVNESKFDKLITILIDLEEKGIIDSFDKGLIYKPLFVVKDLDRGYIAKLLNQYINENNVKGVLEILEYYKLFLNTLKPFVNGIIYLGKMQLYKDAERIISLHKDPYNGFSRSIGGYSPEILNRIELYKEMCRILPYGRLKFITERCIEYLERDMKMDLIRDEEIFNPR